MMTDVRASFYWDDIAGRRPGPERPHGAANSRAENAGNDVVANLAQRVMDMGGADGNKLCAGWREADAPCIVESPASEFHVAGRSPSGTIRWATGCTFSTMLKMEEQRWLRKQKKQVP
jgi:hypothetical protein